MRRRFRIARRRVAYRHTRTRCCVNNTNCLRMHVSLFATTGEMAGAQRWAALEIRLISAFVAVVEKGSFAAAARELGYTQSGVSQQVAALERIADCKLLIRHAGGRRPVQPTAAGRAMLEHSRTLLAQIDKAYDDVTGRTQGEGNTVRAIAFSSIAVHVLPRLLIELRRRGETRVEILED